MDMVMNRRIVVDADSCPVKEEIMLVGREQRVPVFIVASFAHYMPQITGATYLFVDSSSQSVDIRIANFVTTGDVVITGDYGLASLVLRPGVRVLSNRGVEYTLENIDRLLQERHLSAKIRRGGGKTKGPKAITAVEKAKFVESLRKILVSKQEI